MIDHLEYAKKYADSTEYADGEKHARLWAQLAIAHALIALVEQNKAAHKGRTQIRKREMNALEMKTTKSGKHKNLRWVNGTRWLVWREKKKAWVVYDRKHQLIITEDEAEAIKWLLYQEDD